MYLQPFLLVLSAYESISYQCDIQLLMEYSSKRLPEKPLEAKQLQSLCSVDIRRIKARRRSTIPCRANEACSEKRKIHVPNRNDQTLTTKALMKRI